MKDMKAIFEELNLDCLYFMQDEMPTNYYLRVEQTIREFYNLQEIVNNLEPKLDELQDSIFLAEEEINNCLY